MLKVNQVPMPSFGTVFPVLNFKDDCFAGPLLASYPIAKVDVAKPATTVLRVGIVSTISINYQNQIKMTSRNLKGY